MNVLDLVVLGLLVSATVGGYRLGLLMRATSWIGLIIGILAASYLAPRIIKAMGDQHPETRLFVAAGVFMGAAFVGQGLGLVAGISFRRVLMPGPLRQVDRVGGAAAAFVGVIVAVWLMLPSVAAVPGWPAQQAHNSALARTIDGALPRAPDPLQSLRRLVGPEAFPRVFDALRPAPVIGPPPASSGLTPALADKVKASTVKVEGIACSRIQDGSGFSPATDVVVTNAHVVAGERETEVIRPDGRRLKAVVAVFDPNRDLAVLRVGSLAQAPLPIGTARVRDTGGVFGHPNGQAALAISPATVERRVEAVGRDLYDQRETTRQVLILASDLHPGDSGAAFVDRNGAVVGVAFAIAPDRANTAYALTADELRAVLALPRTGSVGTGPCISG